MSYLNELKVAVINEDLKKLEELSKKEFSFSSLEEAKEIQAFIKKAVGILEKEKKKTALNMQKIKKLQKFNSLKEHKAFDFKA
ncbi:MAG: hypothetical protein ABGX26_05645 [Nautiliaceae bacterium]|jgi:hypothetical protein